MMTMGHVSAQAPWKIAALNWVRKLLLVRAFFMSVLVQNLVARLLNSWTAVAFAVSSEAG